MTFAGINYFAVLGAAVAAWVFGGIWYRRWRSRGWRRTASSPSRCAPITARLADWPFIVSLSPT